MSEEVSRAAADVKNAIPGFGADIFIGERASAPFGSEHLLQGLVDRRMFEDGVNPILLSHQKASSGGSLFAHEKWEMGEADGDQHGREDPKNDRGGLRRGSDRTSNR